VCGLSLFLADLLIIKKVRYDYKGEKIKDEMGLVYPVFFHVGNFVFNYLSASGRKGFGEVRGERDGGK
jgi:hypothetical protein